jgi:putative transposase
MSARLRLTDGRWLRLRHAIDETRGRGRPGVDDRRFIEGVLWIQRTGAPWRDLPPDFGSWKTVYNRFDRWAKSGRWDRLFARLRTDGDNEWMAIDSTINRAHQHSAGGKGGHPARQLVVREEELQPRFTS